MGRIFEKRKHKMFARYDKMAKTFTRIGREIAISVKQNGPYPNNNPRLRMAIQNAKANNMPKDRVEAAIKRASSKDEKDFQEVTYEGYGPYGVPILLECATDNPTRTVANVRMYFSRGGGELGKTGSLDFMFTRKGLFRLSAKGVSIEEFELEMIDHGMEEIEVEGDEIALYTAFSDFGKMQKTLEEKKINIISAEKVRIPSNTVDLSEEQAKEILELVDKMEADDDVQAVYHNLK